MVRGPAHLCGRGRWWSRGLVWSCCLVGLLLFIGESAPHAGRVKVGAEDRRFGLQNSAGGEVASRDRVEAEAIHQDSRRGDRYRVVPADRKGGPIGCAAWPEVDPLGQLRN